MTFAKEQLEIKKKVEPKHEVIVTDDINDYAHNPQIKKSFEEELALARKDNIMMRFFNKIAECDALLVCNYPKNGIQGYLGTSVLMEIGLAYYLNKKIILLHDTDKLQNYALEIAIINPAILNGDLSKIK